jgi:hypothetical protein
VRIRFGLRLTNFDLHQAVMLHELHHVWIGAEWEGSQVARCSAKKYVGDRIMLRERMVVPPGSTCILPFHEFDVPDVHPEGMFSITPSFWSQFGVAWATGRLVATVCDESMRETGERLDLEFDASTPIHFEVAREDPARVALIRVVSALVGTNLDKNTLDGIAQATLTSIHEAHVKREG